jgi:hypothetical protein
MGLKGESLPNSDHVLRYCKPTTVAEGVVQASAFELRVDEHGTEEEYLSVFWMEHIHPNDHDLQVAGVLSQSPISLKKNGRLAKLNVGTSKHLVNTKTDHTIDFQHEPNAPCACHAGIFGLSPNSLVVHGLLAQCVQEPLPIPSNGP